MIRYFLIIISFLLVCQVNWACNVPVFRYALERWNADPFRITLLYNESVPQEKLDLINDLQKKSASNETGFNFEFDIAEINQSQNQGVPMEQLGDSGILQVDFPLRWGAINQQSQTANQQNSLNYQNSKYYAAVNKSEINQLLHSPIRDELAQRLIDGQTAVWLFVDGKDPQSSQQAYETLIEEVNHLEEVLELPDLADNTEADTIELGGNLDEVRIDFSVLRLSKEDPEEQILIWQLMHTEPDLLYYQDQPMAFPIYGRGRALYALIGEGINREMITKAGAFLVGPCTCQIKDDNPGKDLLIGVNWENELEHFLVQDKAAPIPFASIADTIQNEQTNQITEEKTASLLSWQFIALVFGLFAIFDVFVFIYLRKRNN